MAESFDQDGKTVIGPDSHTSLTLLEGLREADADAWDRMVKLYYPLVFRWCQQAGLQNDDVLDVVQEVFRAVHRSLPRFRKEEPSDSFRGWLRTITRRKVQDFWRNSEKQPPAAGGPEPGAIAFLQTDEDDPSSIVEDRVGLMHRALELVQSEVEDQTWQLFWRVMMEQESPAEIANELKITTNTVYKAKARVLHRLREHLDGELPTHSTSGKETEP